MLTQITMQCIVAGILNVCCTYQEDSREAKVTSFLQCHHKAFLPVPPGCDLYRIQEDDHHDEVVETVTNRDTVTEQPPFLNRLRYLPHILERHQIFDYLHPLRLGGSVLPRFFGGHLDHLKLKEYYSCITSIWLTGKK